MNSISCSPAPQTLSQIAQKRRGFQRARLLIEDIGPRQASAAFDTGTITTQSSDETEKHVASYQLAALGLLLPKTSFFRDAGPRNSSDSTAWPSFPDYRGCSFRAPWDPKGWENLNTHRSHAPNTALSLFRSQSLSEFESKVDLCFHHRLDSLEVYWQALSEDLEAYVELCFPGPDTRSSFSSASCGFARALHKDRKALRNDITRVETYLDAWIRAQSHLSFCPEEQPEFSECLFLVENTWDCWLKCCDSLMIRVPTAATKSDGIRSVLKIAVSSHIAVSPQGLDRLWYFPHVLMLTLIQKRADQNIDESIFTSSATLPRPVNRALQRFWLLLCGCSFTACALSPLPWSPTQTIRLDSLNELRRLSVMLERQTDQIRSVLELCLMPTLARLQSVLTTLSSTHASPYPSNKQSPHYSIVEDETWAATLRLPGSPRANHLVRHQDMPPLWDFVRAKAQQGHDTQSLKRSFLRHSLLSCDLSEEQKSQAMTSLLSQIRPQTAIHSETEDKREFSASI